MTRRGLYACVRDDELKGLSRLSCHALLWVLCAVFGGAAAAEEPFSVSINSSDPDDIALEARNEQPFPVTARITLRNCRSKAHGTRKNVTAVVGANYTGRLLSLEPIDSGQRYGYSLDYHPGDYRIYRESGDSAPPYFFPFEHGRKYKLGQGFFGRFSHSEPGLEHAVDFQLAEGDPVHAAADGIVLRVQDGYKSGGLDAHFRSRANVIEIYHDDRGTISLYSHLAHDSAVVGAGERVRGGQLIARGGATGYVSGPHLHFAISAPLANGKSATVPYRFRDTDGRAVEPVEGRYYYANHLERADFNVEYGRDLEPGHFAAATPLARRGGELKVVSESLDDTGILYIENPMRLDQEVEITLTLRGYESSAGSRFTKTVPGRSRSFATLLRPLRSAGDLEYNVSYTWRAAGQGRGGDASR